MFRSAFGIGIGRYISTVRLKNALLLLEDKCSSVTEIALECGFGSIRTFYRAFEREFGCSPSEYIKGMKLL